MTDWQPIETAPKDGTQILIWDGVSRVTGYWLPSLGSGYWELVDPGDFCEDAEIRDPTHWVPLPDPPKD